MSRLSEGLTIDQLNSGSEQGQKVLDRNKYLEMYGIDGKEFDVTAIALPSVIVFGKNEAIARREFFKHRNIVPALPNLEFPLKTQAMDISTIRVDVDINFVGTKQESLEKEYYFLKNSVLKTTLNRVEGISIPLEFCVPYIIEFDGRNYRKKAVRNGYNLPAAIHVNMGGMLEVAVDPGTGFVTDGERVNADPAGENTIRVTLMGRTITARIQS